MNDIDRRVAEILGWQVTEKNGRFGVFELWERGNERWTDCPAYSTDPTLTGEMLAWLHKHTELFELCVRNEVAALRWWPKDDKTRMRTELGETINLALCNAIIAINTTPADAGEVTK